MGFALSAKTLQRVFEIWNLPRPSEEQVLFALRGCLPKKENKGWRNSIEVVAATLDYQHLRCTLGIWNQRTGQVFAARGSTVPHRDNVLKAAVRKGVMQGRGTNQMEPGYYCDLRRGEHLQGKPMGHAALRQTGYRFYRRSHHAPPYTNRDPLYFGNPYDNLHSAWNLDGSEAGFRSSGCLVVAGLPHCPRLQDSPPNQGAWKSFHDFIYAASQKNFPLLLLPALSVGKALASKKPTSYLCYGSQGANVEALQAELTRNKLYSGPRDGQLGVAVYRAWNRAGLKGHGELWPR